MKRALRFTPIVLVAALTTVAFGQVANTDHNLNNWPGVTVTTPSGANQVCMPCHVPHNAYPDPAGTIDEVLWNHEDTAVTFTMYETLSGQQGGQPEGPSKMCLSCHNGVTAIDSYGIGGVLQVGTETLSGLSTAVGEGGDLTDDHPIGIVYPVGDPGYNDVTGLQGVQVVEVNGQANRVECTSCHDPHSAALPMFLRLTLDESEICLECHNK
jgi:predicted CXXCH cytochrome family protein